MVARRAKKRNLHALRRIPEKGFFSRYEDELRFLAKFGAWFVALFLLIHVLPLDWLVNGIASIETHELNVLGIPSIQEGSLIQTPHALFEIIVDCSGLVMASLFAALVLSTNVRNRMRALGWGVPFLLVFNLLRLLLTLIAGGLWGQAVLDEVHFALWIVDALVVLFLWTRVVDAREPFPSP